MSLVPVDTSNAVAVSDYLSKARDWLATATRVALRWQDAEITRSEHSARPRHDLDKNGVMIQRPDGRNGGPKVHKRKFDRLCATDL